MVFWQKCFENISRKNRVYSFLKSLLRAFSFQIKEECLFILETTQINFFTPEVRGFSDNKKGEGVSGIGGGVKC